MQARGREGGPHFDDSEGGAAHQQAGMRRLGRPGGNKLALLASPPAAGEALDPSIDPPYCRVAAELLRELSLCRKLLVSPPTRIRVLLCLPGQCSFFLGAKAAVMRAMALAAAADWADARVYSASPVRE